MIDIVYNPLIYQILKYFQPILITISDSLYMNKQSFCDYVTITTIKYKIYFFYKLQYSSYNNKNYCYTFFSITCMYFIKIFKFIKKLLYKKIAIKFE